MIDLTMGTYCNEDGITVAQCKELDVVVQGRCHSQASRRLALSIKIETAWCKSLGRNIEDDIGPLPPEEWARSRVVGSVPFYPDIEL